MFGIYITFGIFTAVMFLATIIQTFKVFKTAGVKGGAVFISILSAIFIVAFAVPMIFCRETFFGVNVDNEAEVMSTFITMGSFFGSWLVAGIVSLIARKYASTHMPVFMPTQVLPNTGIMGGQGYSAPVYPAPYPPQAPPNQYYAYQQGGMPPMPQGYSAPVNNNAYSVEQANLYGQVPPQEQPSYAPYPYAPDATQAGQAEEPQDSQQ